MRLAGRHLPLVAVVWLNTAIGLAWAHGGEEHGVPPPTRSASANLAVGLGNGGAGDRFEAVVTPDESGVSRLFLSDLNSNAPLAEAGIAVEVSGGAPWNGQAEATPVPGIYRLAWTPPHHEAVDVTLTVTVADDADLILIRLPAHPPGTELTPTPVAVGLGPWWGIAVVLLAAGMGGWWWRRRRAIAAAAILALLLHGITSTPVQAHGGEEHGAPARELPLPVATGGDEVALSKASQFLLELRTIPATSREVAETIRLVGRVIPDPAFHARIHPQTLSRIGHDPDFPPPRSGQWVKRGQTLAVLDPVLSAMERAGQRLALFKGERPEATVGRELILATIDGQLTDVHIVPGEVVTEGAVLAEIFDPARLWVEAILYDLPLAERIIDGTASSRQLPGRLFPLQLMGISPRVNPDNQGLHLQFAVETTAGLLKPGMPVDVQARTGTIAFAVAIPRGALLERGGIPCVWVKTAPERFALRLVRPGRRTGEWVEIVEGIRPGDKVVIQGHQQLHAMR